MEEVRGKIVCVSVQTDKMIDVLCKILYHNSRFLKIYTICESIFNGTAFSFRSSDTFFNMLSIFFLSGYRCIFLCWISPAMYGLVKFAEGKVLLWDHVWQSETKQSCKVIVIYLISNACFISVIEFCVNM